MSLHRSHSDVEEGEVFSVSPISDVQDTSHIELMENPSYNNSRPSSPAMIAIPPKKSTFKKKFHGKWWNRIRSLFLGWWARMRSLFLVWWARAVNLFVDWWMGELLAILLSIIAFFAIIYALRKHDGHNLSMLPHHISLNFVISILATVSKTSLLFAVASALGQFKWLWMFSKQRSLQDLQVFDDASRGPLGASRLLASRRSLSWASIGAVVTILCLIYDPFVQGLVKVSERVVYKNNSEALVNRLEKYPNHGGNWKSVDYKLISSISNAAFTPNPLSETQPSCPTGNCTWPPFTSLGFCFKCENITQAVYNSSSYVDEPDNWRTYTYKYPELNGQVLISRRFDLEKDIRSSSANFLPNGWKSGFYVTQLSWDELKPFKFTDGSSVPTVSLLILIRTSSQESNAGDVIAADLCALSFCEQKLNVSVFRNQLSSTVLQTTYGTINMQSEPKKNSQVSRTSVGKRVPFTKNDPHMTFFEMTSEIIPHLSNWVQNLQNLLSNFEDFLSGTPDTIAPQTIATNSIGPFYVSSNISMTMTNIATAMTNHFRDSSNETVLGQAEQTELFIHVNWPWITLPAFLVLAGTIFLFLAMFQTKRLGASIWKTSELAVLFHGSEESSYSDLNAPLGRRSEMDHGAADIEVKMAKTASGKWILRREKVAGLS